jgi:anti-sigma regulatory factor (Ser/Thr protein kinase)
MAACVAPDGDGYGHPLSDLYDFVWYVMTETANNVRQHSGGTGFMTAQVTQAEGFVRLAIADNGRGIRQSFIDAGLRWAAGIDDMAAIRRALEPKISSKGSPSNEGVGLTLSAGLARLAKAWMLIVSGRGVVQMLPDGRQKATELPAQGFYQGTLVALSFKQTDISDFPQLLTAAKISAGLLPPTGVRGTFEA